MTSRTIFSSENFHIIAEEFPVGFPCLTCEENCCTDYLIFITHVDLARIRRALPDLPFRHYVGVSEVSADDYPEVLIKNNPQQLVIRKDHETGRCVFLASGVNMCSIHEFSPYICQMYPFQVPYDDYHELELRQEIRCCERFLCPRESVDGLIEKARSFWQQELPEYVQLVRRWNEERPYGTMDEFISYLMSHTGSYIAGK